MKQYQIIYADPPWSYNDKMAGHSFSLDHEYETQSLDWIKQTPLGLETAKDCTLFLWAVSPLLDEAFEVIKAWGFKYKTVAFVWNKKYKGGGQCFKSWALDNGERRNVFASYERTSESDTKRCKATGRRSTRRAFSEAR